MDQPLAVLTGATGFLGRHVAEALHGSGYRLRVLARDEAAAAPLAGLGPEIVVGRLADGEALERLADGAQVIVHAAGLIKARRPQDFLPVNVEGARAVAQAAVRRAAGAHVILVSSLAARAPQLSAYGASKAAGEAAVRQVLAPERLTIVRPPAVYGPGDRETLALFKAALESPILPRVGPAHARVAMIHAVDAAAQIAALAAKPANGSVYALADGRPEGYLWREVLQAAAAAVDRRRPLAPIPSAVILAIDLANSLIARLGGEPQIMSLGKARELLHPDWGLRPEELAPDAPRPRFDLQTGFADAVTWYRANGWLGAS